MFRFLMLMIGLVLLLSGQGRLQESRTVSSEPVRMELAQLEAGVQPLDRHLEIGAHWKLLDGLVYVYEYEQGKSSDLTPGSKLTEVYYPVISTEHPYFGALAEVSARYDSWDDVPDAELPAVPRDVALLIRTHRFERGRDIPAELEWTKAPRIRGMLVDQRPSDAARRVLAEALPDLDIDRVRILEEDRRPSTSREATIQLTSGALVSLAAGGLLLRRRNRRKLWPKHLRGKAEPSC